MKNYQKLIMQSLIVLTLLTIVLKLFGFANSWLVVLIPFLFYLCFLIIVVLGIVIDAKLKQLFIYLKNQYNEFKN